MRIFLGIAAVIVTIAVILGGSYISAHNKANSHEQGIIAAQDNSEVILGQYGQKIREISQVPGMQAEDLVNIITAANESRYGSGGLDGVMTWITEQNPNLDQATYTQLQWEISAGREQFTQSQSLVVDRVRAYKTDLGSFWTGTWMSTSGWPRINLEDYGIVTTQDARDTFTTKTDQAPITLRD